LIVGFLPTILQNLPGTIIPPTAGGSLCWTD